MKRSQIHQLVDEFRMQYNFACSVSWLECKKNQRVRNFVSLIYGMLIMPTICSILGHKMVSLDYGTPNSGGIGCECTRCGYGWFEQLY